MELGLEEGRRIMAIKNDVDKAIEAFEKANPKLEGKVQITSMERTWQKQLAIVLRRRSKYPNISANFCKEFPDTKAKWPNRVSQLSQEQLDWWKREILMQAGKSPGFAHVGGKAVDISVGNLNAEGKKLFKDALKEAGVDVLMEYVSGDDADYKASIGKANVFHCTN
jgi:hypothetical protein